jgi:hypothetical protein
MHSVKLLQTPVISAFVGHLALFDTLLLFSLAQNNAAFQNLLNAKYKVQSHYKVSVMLKA